MDGGDERKRTVEDASLLPQGAVKTGVDYWFRDQVGTKPAYGPNGSRCIGGMNSIRALVRNVRTSLRMQREMTSG